MESLASIQKAIDYIEENLKNDISIGQVAAAIGYSEYHFLRIFKHFVGFTPASYIRKRRISEIVAAMEHNDSSRPISDIAFECGFNSKENFIRAFKAEHHILPTEYRRHGNSLKLYGRFELVPKREGPLCDIVELDAFRVVAFPSNGCPRIWEKMDNSVSFAEAAPWQGVQPPVDRFPAAGWWQVTAGQAMIFPADGNKAADNIIGRRKKYDPCRQNYQFTKEERLVSGRTCGKNAGIKTGGFQMGGRADGS